MITLGNHTYRHREICRYLDSSEPIMRPPTTCATQPGHGTCVVERDGVCASAWST